MQYHLAQMQTYKNQRHTQLLDYCSSHGDLVPSAVLMVQQYFGGAGGGAEKILRL